MSGAEREIESFGESEARAEIDRLHELLAEADRAYFEQDAPTITDAEVRRDEAPLPGVRDRVPDIEAHRQPLRQGRRRRRSRASPRSGMPCPCSASPRPIPTRTWSISSSAASASSSATRISKHRLHRRAQDRRPFGLAALRERRVRAGRDARRRRGGRGHHRQPQDHRRYPAQAEGLGLAAEHRDPRRGLHDLWPSSRR